MSVFVESGLDLSPIITHRLPASQFAEGFEAMAHGKAGKVVLNWEEHR
jgi:threonine 3-dehydrogenase